ncbi:unnamed protein product [Closterium sp. NIES-54]
MMLPVIVPPQGGFRLLSEVPLLDSPRLSLVGLRNNRGASQFRAKVSSATTRASIPQKEHHYGHLSSGHDHGRAARGPAVVKHENDFDNVTFDNGVRGDSNLRTNSASSHGEKIMVSVRIHSVSAGETVSSIASSYSIPVDALLAANGKSSPSIRVGEVLYLPSSSAPSVASSQSKAHSGSQAGHSQFVSLHIRENHGTSSRQSTLPTGSQECVRLCTDSSATIADATSISTRTTTTSTSSSSSSSSSSGFSDAWGASAAAAASAPVATAGRVCLTSCRTAPTGRGAGMRMRVRGWLKNSSGAVSASPDTRVNVSLAAPCEGTSPALLVTSAPAAPAAAPAVLAAASAAAVADASAGGSTHVVDAPDAHSQAASAADTASATSAAAEYELSGFANFFAARKHLSRTMHLEGWRKGPGGAHTGSDGSRQGVVASVTQALVPVRGGEVEQSLPLIGLGVAITVAAGALAVRSGLHDLVRAALLLRLQGFSQKQHDQRQQQQEQEKEQQGEGSEQNVGRMNEQELLQRVKDEKRLEFSKRALKNYLDLQKREVKRSGMEGAALRLKMRMAKANGKDPLPFAPLQYKMGPRRNVMAEIRSVVAEAVAEVVEGEECMVVLERSKALVKDTENTGEARVVGKGVASGNSNGVRAEQAGRMIEMMEKGWYGGAGKTEMNGIMGLEGDEDGLGEVGPEVFLEWSVEKAREANAHAMGYTKEGS